MPSNIVQYNSPVASMTITEDGIYILNLKDTYTPYDEAEAKNQFDFFYEHSNGKPYKVFIDASISLNLPTEEAIAYFTKLNKPEYRFAVLATTLPIQIYIGQIIKYKSNKNMKLFKKTEEAMNWLLEK